MQSRPITFLERACTVGGLLLLAGAGCSFNSGGVPIAADASASDAALVDASGIDSNDDPCLQWTYTPRFFAPCVAQDPIGGLLLDMTEAAAQPSYLYNTTNGQLTDPMGNTMAHRSQLLSQEPQIRLASVDSFAISAGATLRVIGDYPLLIASWADMDISGTIDATSYSAPLALPDDTWSVGAGANPETCGVTGLGGDGDTDVEPNQGRGSGGGGGGFGGSGGAGGSSNAAVPGTAGASLGGVPDNLRGGCPGGKGGDGTNFDVTPDSGGAGGLGGGAVHLTARLTLTVSNSGVVEGGGGGGLPGLPDEPDNDNDNTHRVGGGGGGSGGYIGLEAPEVTIGSATLAANGGGGGACANNHVGVAGEDGLPGRRRSLGGEADDGDDGGDGGWDGDLAGAPGISGGNCGGGGGGGVGLIVIDSPASSIDPGAEISPASVEP